MQLNSRFFKSKVSIEDAVVVMRWYSRIRALYDGVRVALEERNNFEGQATL